jgi:hypothetical protein
VQISKIVVQIHANGVLNIGVKKMSKFIVFRFWGGGLARRVKQENLICEVNNNVRITAKGVQIHANGVLNIGVKKMSKFKV